MLKGRRRAVHFRHRREPRTDEVGGLLRVAFARLFARPRTAIHSGSVSLDQQRPWPVGSSRSWYPRAAMNASSASFCRRNRCQP